MMRCKLLHRWRDSRKDGTDSQHRRPTTGVVVFGPRQEGLRGGRENEMNNAQPCFTGCDDNRLPADNFGRARDIEDFADSLMAECVTFAGANDINRGHDLYDGILLPQMMQAVACWQGSGASAISQMHALHNLLANALQTIAEREVSK